MIVMKFGGTSLGDPDRIRTAATLIGAHVKRGVEPVVVLSAHAGVTNGLLAAAEQALVGQVDIAPIVNRHRRICTGLGLEADLVTEPLLELELLLRGISLVGELTPRSLDYVASFGERCSIEVLGAYLNAQGVPAVPTLAWDIGIVTDESFGAAKPLAGIEADIRERLGAIAAQGVPLVTGYIAKDRKGEITTFGRNGSDFTATLLGGALNADEVQIWTDVDGVMTADPALVPHAQPLRELAYEEAAELAYYGARVLHPATLRPAMARDIPVRVLNTLRPDAPGTRIVRTRASDAQVVKSIAYQRGQYVLNITAAQLLQESGMMARIFSVLGAHGIDINLITTSEVTISMTTGSSHNLESAVAALSAFCDEVTVESERAIVGVVGQDIRVARGVVGTVFACLNDVDVPVHLVSVGASKVNVTFVIDGEDVPPAVRALHARLFDDRQLSAAQARENAAPRRD